MKWTKTALSLIQSMHSSSQFVLILGQKRGRNSLNTVEYISIQTLTCKAIKPKKVLIYLYNAPLLLEWNMQANFFQ